MPQHDVSGYRAVVDIIRREMALGRILPGHRLPAERKLAEQLGVARETIRQALRVLHDSGQITIERGAHGGAVILQPRLSEQVVLDELRSRRDEMKELFEFRLVIECAAARLAASRRADTDLSSMKAAQQALLDADNRDLSRSADTAFHLAVAHAAGNQRLLHAVENARAEMFVPIDLLTFTFITQTSHQGHEAVLRAVRACNPNAAEKAMRRHLEQARDELLNVIDHGP